MRLTSQQINDITSVLNAFLEGCKAELRLYGSRVNDDKKGGDIDLLLLVENPNLEAELAENKHYLLAAIKKNIGDQKIDLLVSSYPAVKTYPFLKMVFPKSLLLKHW